MRVALVRSPIDIGALQAEVSSPESGAISVFVGMVRNENDGRAVDGIEYTAYDAMAELEMQRLLDEARERFGITRAVIEHRVGELAVGDASVAIVVSHAHRAPALDATRYLIEELKKRVPVWKRELYADGTREWVDPTRRVVEATP